MNEIFDYLRVHQAILWMVVSTMAVIFSAYHWWNVVKLFVKDFWYGAPVIGKTVRLSHDANLSSGGWFRSEEALCADFYGDLKQIGADGESYERAKSYLSKVQELGRNKLSAAVAILISMLVFVEALGFAFVLSGKTLPGASEKLQAQGAIGIAFLISVILVGFTHFSGHELHHRSLVKKARTWWNNDQRANRPNLIGGDEQITLDTNWVDDNQPNYIKLINRLKVNAHVTPGLPWITMATAGLIVLVAVFATAIRFETAERLRSEESMGQQTTSAESFPGLTVLPKALTKEVDAANKKGQDEMIQQDRAGDLMTFIMLAVVFVFIQVMGIIIGYRTGFAGTESAAARRIVGPFATRMEYEVWHQRRSDEISRLAQRHLSRLQARLAVEINRNSVDQSHREAINKSADRSFTRYTEIRLKKESELAHARNEMVASAHAVQEAQRRPGHTVAQIKETQPAPMPEPRQPSPVASLSLEESIQREEEQNLMEERIRQEEEAKLAAEKPIETEEQMRARIRAELRAKQQEKA